MDILKRPDHVPNSEGVSQKHKYIARSVSAFSAIFAIILGFWVSITLSPKCVLAGLCLIVTGALILMIEAPVCCSWVRYTEKVVEFSDSRPYWQKAVLYCGLALPPIFICPGLSSIGAALFVFLSGVIYGSMALGKKASREEMIAKVANTPQADAIKVTLVNQGIQHAANRMNG